MRTISRNKLGIRVLLLLVAALLAGAVLHSNAEAAPITVDLCATTGSTTMPGGASVNVWGYVLGDCSGAPTVSQPGGPVIDVNEGDVVTVILHNGLSETTALLFQGQAMAPDLAGVAAGGTKPYTFTATDPGTYLYEAGLLANAQHQVAMGLYGALVVRPATAGQAYDDASTAFNDEAVLVLSEIDPALNSNPAGFDMRNYAPKYRLINGKAYPGTSQIPVTAAGDQVLLRFVNAGLEHHSMSLLGLHQSVVANDGSLLAHARTVVAETIAPGQTQDSIATVPAAAVGGTRFALYGADLILRNSNAAGAGGMLTFLTVGSGTPPGGTGPTTSAVTLSPNPSGGTAPVTLNATITPGPSSAEYFVDATGTNGSGCAMTVSSTTASATIPTSGASAPCTDLATLSSGKHTFYVHGQDATGWGPFAFAVLNLDKTGPTTSLLTLAPNPSNGSVDVVLSGTANDSASGGSNIQAAEYTIDGGAAAGMAVSAASPIATITASIPAATVSGLSQGTHTVAVRSQDALGNWGSPASLGLVADKTGPTVSGSVTAAPNPTNGVAGYNSSTPAVRVTATFVDTFSAVKAAEGFIDTTGANGTGFIFVASDGAFNSLTETGYADIPLSTIQQLSNGTHTISVHGKDAAGNWGASYGTVNLIVDKTNPTLTAITLTPSTIAAGAASVTLNATASDNAGGTGIAGGQYWIDGSATPPANATSFNGTSTSINTSTLPAGNHTVYARVSDAASNWSTVSSAALVVIQATNDSVAITANTNSSQTFNIGAPGVLTNDQPTGAAGRTAVLASAPVRTSGSGAGTMTVTCPSTLGTPATPAISLNTVCTNGAYRITLTGVGNSGNARRNSKRGTFQFTYTERLNGASSTATVTITVN